MEYNELIRLWKYAFQMLYKKDRALFEADVQERAIAGRLAIYLQHKFDPDFLGDYCIDIEYNKEGCDSKRPHVGDIKGWIAPDIILHRRGNERNNNIFYFEMKKKEEKDNKDSIRVRDALWERHYIFGINLYAINERQAHFSVYKHSSEFIEEEEYIYDACENVLKHSEVCRLWSKELVEGNRLDWIVKRQLDVKGILHDCG